MGEVIGMPKADHLQVMGASRAASAPHALVYSFNRTPTDQEMRLLNDAMSMAVTVTHVRTDELVQSATHPAVSQLVNDMIAQAGPRDWPKDFTNENGKYLCNCGQCGEQFMGHKRRVVCKTCSDS